MLNFNNFNNLTIKNSKEVKILGIKIDSNLTTT